MLTHRPGMTIGNNVIVRSYCRLFAVLNSFKTATADRRDACAAAPLGSRLDVEIRFFLEKSRYDRCHHSLEPAPASRAHCDLPRRGRCAHLGARFRARTGSD